MTTSKPAEDGLVSFFNVTTSKITIKSCDRPLDLPTIRLFFINSNNR